MNLSSPRSLIFFSLLAAGLLCAPSALFAQFSTPPNPINAPVTTQRTLTTGTGTITSTGSIIISSGNTVPLLMSGTSALQNDGTIQTLGGGRALDSNTAGANLTITNTGLISSVSADAFRVGTDSAVSLTNSGTIQVTAGGQALDWASITTKTNKLDNQAGGKITAVGEDAVRPGTNGVVNNAGTIEATPTGTTAPSGSDGIDVRTFTGIQVTNSGTITGRHGIATDGSNVGPSAITVTNNAGGVIAAKNGSALNIDGPSATVTANVTNAAGATMKGGVSAGATEGDGDGIDVDGVLTLQNSGNVLGLGARGASNNAEGIAAGGGSITNYATGKITGSTTAADAPNGDPTRAGNGILIDDSNGGNAVAATTVDNSGLIQGVSGFGIKVVGTFADSITNKAGGTIQGAGTGAAIQTGGGDDTVDNLGAIISDIGNAIDLEAGNDLLKIEGNAASIAGNLSGGDGVDTLALALGTGNTFSFADLISKFETLDVQSGLFVLNGADRVAATTNLQLSGGALEVVANGPNGQTFASLGLSADSAISLDPTSLTFGSLGAITPGATLAITGYVPAFSPDYAIRFLGNLTLDPTFLGLMTSTTINGLNVTYNFDGTFTNVHLAPEPRSLLIFGALGLVLMARRRPKIAGG